MFCTFALKFSYSQRKHAERAHETFHLTKRRDWAIFAIPKDSNTDNMRIICLDIGSKRIGVAASDPFGWTAQGLEVIERKGNKKDMERICEICRELEAERIVAGLPLNEEGGIGPAAKKVQVFVEKFKTHLKKSGLDIEIELWDERYSTATAEERLIEADVSRKKRKRVIDKMAAIVILQDYLEVKGISTDVGESTEG